MPACMLLLLLVVTQLPQGAVVPGGDPLIEVQRTAQQWLDAVHLYRGDDVEAAVRALDTLTPTAEERVLDYARRVFVDIRERGVKARPAGFRWQLADLTAAGALQMEAAIVASRAPDERAGLRMAAHLALADRIFALIAETGGDVSEAPKWRLALGLTTMVAFQAFFNISVVLGLLPTKGIPLPFVSYGGSSLLINLLGMAMLLNVSQHASTPHVVTTTLPVADA